MLIKATLFSLQTLRREGGCATGNPIRAIDANIVRSLYDAAVSGYPLISRQRHTSSQTASGE